MQMGLIHAVLYEIVVLITDTDKAKTLPSSKKTNEQTKTAKTKVLRHLLSNREGTLQFCVLLCFGMR